MVETSPGIQRPYAPLISEFEAILRVALRNDPEFDGSSPWIVQGMQSKEQGGVRLMPGECIPSGRAKPKVAGTWTPDRQVLAELLARTLENRSKRWLPDEQRYLAMPDRWPDVLRKRWPSQFECEMSIGQGWVDLLIATHMWLEELGTDFRWSQIKEKFGGIRLYFDGDVGVAGNDIITTAEYVLSYLICDTCGAPGRKGSIRGWYVTRCHDHAKSEE